ncbi:hypothetical protein ACSKAH_002964 [Vibrio vulnificus]
MQYNQSEKAIQHGKKIGLTTLALFIKRGILPKDYEEQFMDSVPVSYGDGGGTPIAILPVEKVRDVQDAEQQALDYFFTKKLSITSNSEEMGGGVFIITTRVSTGSGTETFSCEYHLNESPLIPASVYEAVGHICKELPFYHPEAVTSFCAATFSLAGECFDYVDFPDGEPFYFDAELSVSNEFTTKDQWAQLEEELKAAFAK